MTHLSRNTPAFARSTMAALIAATALGVTLGATPTAARAQSLGQRIDTTFAVDRNAWLDVNVVSGTIIVTGWTRTDARIVARTENGVFEGTFRPDRIDLSVRTDRNSRNRNRSGPSYVEISVPVGTRVMASTISGGVRIRGTNAEVQATAVSGSVEVVDAIDRIVVGTVSGDIRLERVRGRTRINSTSGDLELDSITGELEIRTVSSDMRIDRVVSSEVRIGTTNGDISYGGTIDPKGTYDISTHSGDVQFEVPSTTGATLSLQTFSGDIESSFPMTLQPGDLRRQRGRRMEFAIGDGGARVSITTFSGDITILRGSSRSPREE